jgi:hypothetical protein
MVAHGRDKVIQVQKPAQSLQAFQQKVASGEDLQVGYLKPLLIGAGVAVVAVGAFFGIQAARSSSLARHNEALAKLQLEVGGNPATPGLDVAGPAELEKRMRDRLPQLEALANSAPSGARAATSGLLATWRTELGVPGSAPAAPTDPWGLLRLAQKQVALGQGQEAAASLAPLRAKAGPDQAWGSLYWSTLLDADRLQGNRDQAWKDLAEYKARFRDQADASLDRMLAGV